MAGCSSAAIEQSIVRTVGDWDVIADLGSAHRTYVSKMAGTSQKHIPEEVRPLLLAPLNRPPPTRHSFSSLRPHLRAGEACSICNGTGQLLHDSCPVCDGAGREPGEDWDASDSNVPLWTRGAMQRQEMLPDGLAFVLRGLMTRAEVSDVLCQAETFGYRPCPEAKRIRVTERVLVMAGALAELLFARALPHLEDVTISESGERAKGIPHNAPSGKWVPVGLNPCFRVCRYSPGGFFLPHFDAGFDESNEVRSFKTFMLYLNDVDAGGPTCFYSDVQKHYQKPDPQKVVSSLQPECGSCLIFNHCITHDGGKLDQGLKFLLRTEVMYRLQK